MRLKFVILVGLSAVMFISGLQSVCFGEVSSEQTIVATETESYFYADGKMKKSGGMFEITYYLSGDTITRTRVYDLKKKEVIPDDTVYQIQRHLTSDPNGERYGNKPVIRAIGQPGTDAVEILTIDDNMVQSCKSTSDYFVISRSKRIK